MGNEYTIKFGKSSSLNYQSAIDLAHKFSNFKQISDDSPENIIIIDNKELFKKTNTFLSLYNIINSWKSSSFYYNGEEIQGFNFFNQLSQIQACSNGYENSSVKISYCNINSTFQGWNCKLLTEVKRHIDGENQYYNFNYWYRFGFFETPTKWVINKSNIKDVIKTESETKLIKNCPFFSIDKVFEIIDNLPDFVELENNQDWEIEFKEDFIGTIIEKIPINIKHINRNKKTFSKDSSSFSLSLDSQNDNSKNRYIPSISFDDIGGIDHIIDQIREVIELPLKRPDIFKYLDIKAHKGILLFGDPGNGKTLVAKAIANEVKAHFIPISGPELLSKWHGQSEENLRNVFKVARDLQPSIIFFDEIDSIGQSRSNEDFLRLDSKFVNQLLSLMDGMESFENVTVLASTNRPELLDEALLRPGRFDFKIEIKKPDLLGCYKILKVATRKMPIDPSFVFDDFVPKLVGCSGAEIVFVVKEAAVSALKRMIDVKTLITENSYSEFDLNKIKVTEADFIKAIEILNANKLTK